MNRRATWIVKVGVSEVRLKFYGSILRPLLFLMDAERAHSLALITLKSGFYPRDKKIPDPILKSKLWDLEFPTPVGVAAGFDKNAEVFGSLLKLGFGFVETGTVTPVAQSGNDKPRIFRLPEDLALINRLGFNNKGLDCFTNNIARWSNQGGHGIIGVNLGKNRNSEDDISDFVSGVQTLSDYASYLVINISSPNTPGLRDLQSRDKLKDLLESTMAARGKAKKSPPLLVKMAPDLSNTEISDVAEVAKETKVDGIIISNTTVERPNSLRDKNRLEKGGLSGEPLFDSSTELVRDMYSLTKGRIPLIGVGGISSGDQAYAKIRAGASLVQLYSSMIYQGPIIASKVSEELAFLLRKDKFANISEAIGVDHS